MPWLARSHLVLAKCKWSRAWRASHPALLGLPRLQDSYQPPSHLFSCRQTKLLILTLTSSTTKLTLLMFRLMAAE